MLRLAAVCLVFMPLAAPGVILAQGDGETEEAQAAAQVMMMEERYSQRYTPRIRMISIMCRWTDEQHEAARTLLESHVQRITRANIKLNEYVTFLDKERSAGEMAEEDRKEKQKSVYRDSGAYNTRVTEELKADLKDLMTEEQLPYWKWAEKLWRVHELEWMMYGSGSSSQNLLRAITSRLTDAEVSTEMRAVLENYLTEIDRALDQIEADRKKLTEDMTRIRSDETLTEEVKAEAIRQLGQPWVVANAMANDISEASLRRLLPLLPEMEAVEVELGFYERSDFMSEQMRLDIGALSRKVMGMKSVTEEQRTQIRAFRLQVGRERLAELKNERQAERDNEEQGFDQAKMMAEMQAKSKAATRALERLRTILTPEQIEEVGPPINESSIYVPDFESDEEPPKRKASPMGVEMHRNPGAPPVNVLDVAYLSRMAGLSAEQKDAATDLVSGYESRFRLTMRKVKAFESSIQSSMMEGGRANPALMKRGMRVMTARHRYLTRIHGEVMNDLHDLMTEDQLPKWAAFERRIARKSLSQGEMAYGGAFTAVDLPGMLEGAYVDGAVPSDAAMEELESYEREMQPLVAEISAIEAKMMAEMEKSFEAGEFEVFALVGRMQEEELKLEEHQTRVDELTRRYFEKLSGLLEGEPRMEFEEAMYSATMRPLEFLRMNALVTRSGQELVRDIDRLKDLTEEQRAQVSEISRGKRVEIHGVQKGLYEALIAIEGVQKDWTKLLEENRIDRMKSLCTRLNELNDSMVKELLAVLTPEQVGRLPKHWRTQEKVSYPRFDED